MDNLVHMKSIYYALCNSCHRIETSRRYPEILGDFWLSI